MRQLATALSVTLALSGLGCAAARRPAAAPAAGGLSEQEPRYAAVSPGARAAGGAGSPSRGSPSFGNFVRTREPQLQFCYQEARASSPQLTGSATVAVTLADDGGVVDARIVRHSWSNGARGSDVVERCMLEKVRSWRFPSIGSRDEHVHSFSVIFSS
jgi:hypothetical protein